MATNPAYQLCLCGHIRHFHNEEGEQGYCLYSSRYQRPAEVKCQCDSFQMDNLKLLEEALDAKTARRD
jgi:hypothetical protein